jgi:hypothetical protein
VPVPGTAGPALTVDVDGHRLLGALGAYGDCPTLTVSYSSSEEPIAISAAECRTLLVPRRQREEPVKKMSKQSA